MRAEEICLMFILARTHYRNASSARGSDGAEVWSRWSSAESTENLQSASLLLHGWGESQQQKPYELQKPEMACPQTEYNQIALLVSASKASQLHTHSSKEQFQSFFWQ